jgi:uncharacterized protein YuzE
MSNITIKEIQLSDGSMQEQVFIEIESGTTIIPKSIYDAQQVVTPPTNNIGE